MKLKFITTIGQQKFRLDDEEDEAPMMQIEFFNELAEGFSYEKRMEAAREGLTRALHVLLG